MKKGRPKTGIELEKRILFAVTKEDFERLKAEAKKRRMSLSSYIRFLLFNDEAINRLRRGV